ncbi:MAG TPA: hypothetical protein VK929_03925 [Longimicrobiales bacterium]|nr:hypothetical protein [Longimicrobiales bacterium]
MARTAWRLATALFVAEDPADLPFYTLDQRQRDVAMALNCPVRSWGGGPLRHAWRVDRQVQLVSVYVLHA